MPKTIVYLFLSNSYFSNQFLNLTKHYDFITIIYLKLIKKALYFIHILNFNLKAINNIKEIYRNNLAAI